MEKHTRLFVACSLALVSVAFGFIIRAFLINEWQVIFNLSKTQIGSIQGAGLYPNALAMILLSLIVDRVGYGRVIAFAWVVQVASAVVTVMATGYRGLYWGTFLLAVANGSIEAVINPVTATLYPHTKTQRLNMLHASWPAGMVIGGVLAILMGTSGGADAWRWKVSLYLIPTFIYGFLMLGKKFPVQERVAAGVSYADMFREFGLAGCFIVSVFAAYALDEILGVFGSHLPGAALLLIPLLITGLVATRIRSFGRPLFIFLLLVMLLLATTELGTDSWIAALMEPVLKRFGPNAGKCVIIYTSAIMFVLRFWSGSITRRLSPLSLLAICAAVASAGLSLAGPCDRSGNGFSGGHLLRFRQDFFLADYPRRGLGVVSQGRSPYFECDRRRGNDFGGSIG